MLKMKLNSYDRFDGVRSMTKTRRDNNETNYTSKIYAEIGIELSRSIR